jgi:hypothetical protein
MLPPRMAVPYPPGSGAVGGHTRTKGSIVTSWTPEDFHRVADTREIDIATRRKDGSLRSYVTIGVVSDGSDLYVRSWKGTNGTQTVLG